MELGPDPRAQAAQIAALEARITELTAQVGRLQMAFGLLLEMIPAMPGQRFPLPVIVPEMEVQP